MDIMYKWMSTNSSSFSHSTTWSIFWDLSTC